MRQRTNAIAAALALVAATLAAAGEAPRSQSILLDGDASDWGLVLSSAPNVSRDGLGSGGACALSTDRDCPVASGVNDLLLFAWTWDADRLYVLVERAADRGPTEIAWIYVDADDDGLMESGEPVVQLEMDTSAMSLLRYWPATAGGDPMTDAAGLADGYTLPGLATWIGNLPSAPPGDERRVEAGVDWSALGLAPGAAFGWHVSTGSGLLVASNVQDDMGGPDGGAGRTAWRALTLAPPTDAAAGRPGAPAVLRHVLTNAGNVTSTPLLRMLGSRDAPCEAWIDDDLDGAGDRLVAVDARCDGSLRGPGDALLPAGDSDGDGAWDAGALAPGASLAIVVESTCPDAGSASIELRATDSLDASVVARAFGTLRAGLVTLEADVVRSAVAGSEATCVHVLRNNGSTPIDVDLQVESSFGWPWRLHEDVDGNGDPAGDPVVGENGRPLATLDPGASVRILAVASVPAGAPAGFVESAVVRASVGAAVASSVVDELTIARPVDLSPHHLRDQGREHRSPAGGAVHFAHRVVSSMEGPQAITLSASSPEGWVTSLLTDPDGDGRPSDSAPLVGDPIVPGGGGRYDFIVRVELPADALPPSSSRVQVHAQAPIASASDDAYDDAVSAIVTTWEDASHAVSLAETTPCATVHALAAGTPAGDSLRLEWRDPAASVQRVAGVTADPEGRGSDALTLGAGAIGPGWVVEARSSGGTLLDTATFAVVRPVRVDALSLPSAPHPQGLPLAWSAAVRNASDTLHAAAWLLRLRVRDEAGTIAWDGASFVPLTGAEWSHSETLPPLRRSEGAGVSGRLGVAFPSEGRWVVEAWIEAPCGGATLEALETLEVVADADADGLTDADEALRGTSPTDADTDDDGLPDGEEPDADSDGDGVTDALECDADGDGLGDGLESGLTSAGPATGGGCFVPDGDPSTTTDPARADTDGGGLPDGAEDRDGDGVLDASERDPGDAADDALGCASAIPPDVDDLRMSRAGAGVALAWGASSDPCAAYRVETSPGLPLAWLTQREPHRGTTFVDASAAGALRFWRVEAFTELR